MISSQRKARAIAPIGAPGALRRGRCAHADAAALPGRADLAWASFPCQDLSLAGGGAGLTGERSGAFWPLMRLVAALRAEGRHPPLLALENVCGALTSHDGRDFAAICGALAGGGLSLRRADGRCGAVRAAIAAASLHPRGARRSYRSRHCCTARSQRRCGRRARSRPPSSSCRRLCARNGCGGVSRRPPLRDTLSPISSRTRRRM